MGEEGDSEEFVLMWWETWWLLDASFVGCAEEVGVAVLPVVFRLVISLGLPEKGCAQLARGAVWEATTTVILSVVALVSSLG